MQVKFNSEVWDINTKEDFERMLWLSDSELLSAYQYILDIEEDEKRGYIEDKNEWEQIADGYHTAMNDVYNIANDLYSYCKTTNKLNRKALMDYANNIINACLNV